MSERGVFAVDRGIWSHPLFDDDDREFSRREAWLWMISEAAWKPHRIRRAGKPLNLLRGQLAHSLRYMAEQWRWPETRVRRFIAALVDDAMLGAQSDAGITVLTVIKYDEYQRVSLPDGASSGAQSDAEPAHDRRKEEDIKNKEEEVEVVTREAGAGISREAFAVSDKLFLIFNLDTEFIPPGWCGAPRWVQKCLNEGVPVDVILSTAQGVKGKKRDGPPDSFIYLEKPLARAIANINAPLPTVKNEDIHGHRPDYRRTGSAAAWRDPILAGMANVADSYGLSREPEEP